MNNFFLNLKLKKIISYYSDLMCLGYFDPDDRENAYKMMGYLYKSKDYPKTHFNRLSNDQQRNWQWPCICNWVELVPNIVHQLASMPSTYYTDASLNVCFRVNIVIRMIFVMRNTVKDLSNGCKEFI